MVPADATTGRNDPFLVNERAHRTVSLILAALLAATVAYVWI